MGKKIYCNGTIKTGILNGICIDEEALETIYNQITKAKVKNGDSINDTCIGEVISAKYDKDSIEYLIEIESELSKNKIANLRPEIFFSFEPHCNICNKHFTECNHFFDTTVDMKIKPHKIDDVFCGMTKR